jgi:two-component system cell cycle response regulator CpdR
MAHILLAEDDRSMRDFLTQALIKADHTVQAYEDGLSALQALNHGCDFDLLLTDIVMPGMDGIELAQKATTICPDMKVMFITGFAAVAIGQPSVTEGRAKVLSKPFHLKDLVDQVENLMKAA